MRTIEGERFGLRSWRATRWLMTLFGMGPRRGGVTLTESGLGVRAWPFHVDIPLSAVASAAAGRTPWWAPYGVHTSTRGRWVVAAAPGAVVRIALSRPCEGRFFGFPVRVSRLDVGTADDAGLLRALSERVAPEANRLDGGVADPVE